MVRCYVEMADVEAPFPGRLDLTDVRIRSSHSDRAQANSMNCFDKLSMPTPYIQPGSLRYQVTSKHLLQHRGISRNCRPIESSCYVQSLFTGVRTFSCGIGHHKRLRRIRNKQKAALRTLDQREPVLVSVERVS